MVRKDESIEKTYFVFWFSWKPLCFKRWGFKTTFKCDKKKSNFVKIKNIIKSSHPPLEPILITTKKDEVTKEEVKASPFKIADDKTPIVSLIEQNNFTNESLHIIGQQLDHIEEKIIDKTASVEKSVFVKIEKPLIDLSSQREKVVFKTS